MALAASSIVSTAAVGLIILAAAALALRSIWKKKNGGGCGCGCRGCANAPYCHPQKDAQASKST